MTDPMPADYPAALAYLYGRIDYERNAKLPYRSRGLKLDRMRELAVRLGNPQQQYPIVHVAGTKGKGSTSTMIAASLTAAGYRTGLYTSPHLACLEERLAVAGTPCSQAELVALLHDLRPVVDEMDAEAERRGEPGQGPTFFEITTAAALLHFQRQGVAAAVLEVGLGGRLDSTNICQPEVSVITSISFDHMRQLGNTLAKIAGEKAGIIKPGVPVVSGVTAAEPREVIEGLAAARGCRCWRLGRDFHVRYHSAPSDHASTSPHVGMPTLDYFEADGSHPLELRDVVLGMLGEHQSFNAAVALAALNRLRERGWEIPEAALRAGLSSVHCPARAEVLRMRPVVLVDAAHNVASAQALLAVLRESFSHARRRILLFAASRDKDAAGMLRLLLPEFDTVILTRFLHNPRFTEPAALAQLAQEALGPAARRPQLLTRPDPISAWEEARSLAQGDDLICIAGSFFLAAELRQVVQ